MDWRRETEISSETEKDLGEGFASQAAAGRISYICSLMTGRDRLPKSGTTAQPQGSQGPHASLATLSSRTDRLYD